MKYAKIILFFILTHCWLVSTAQNNNEPTKPGKQNGSFAVSLGAAVNYYYGPADRNFSKFEDNRVNWHINAMIGFALATDKAGRQTILGIFGNYGFNNAETVDQLIKDQGYTSAAVSQSSVNNYFQAEFGVLIAGILRLSSGYGQQQFDDQALTSSSGATSTENSLSYYSSTVGLQFAIGRINWLIHCNIATGRDFDKTVLTPSTGLSFKF